MIKKEDVEHAAILSRIGLDPEEKEDLKKDLSRVLDYIIELPEKSEVKKADPMDHPIKIKSRTREDVPRESLLKEEIINLFPKKEKRFLKVPSVKNVSFKKGKGNF